MRIGAHDYIPGEHQPLFRQHHVLDAKLAAIEIDQPMLMSEVPEELCILSGKDILCRHVVVRHHHHPLGVEYRISPQALKLPDGDGRCYIIGHNQVNPDGDKFARADPLFATMGSENLFG